MELEVTEKLTVKSTQLHCPIIFIFARKIVRMRLAIKIHLKTVVI